MGLQSRRGPDVEGRQWRCGPREAELGWASEGHGLGLGGERAPGETADALRGHGLTSRFTTHFPTTFLRGPVPHSAVQEKSGAVNGKPGPGQDASKAGGHEARSGVLEPFVIMGQARGGHGEQPAHNRERGRWVRGENLHQEPESHNSAFVTNCAS